MLYKDIPATLETSMRDERQVHTPLAATDNGGAGVLGLIRRFERNHLHTEIHVAQ